MPYNGVGQFELVSGNPVVTGTVISSTWANNTLSDIVNNGLSNVITKDGQTTPTNNIPMGGFKFTGLGAPAATGQALRWDQLVKGADIASVDPLPIPNEGQIFDVTGSTTITGFSGAFPGRLVYLRFKAAITLTNSASFLMPNGVDLKPYPNEVYAFCNTEGTTWACVDGPPRLPLLYRNGGVLSPSTTSISVTPGAWRSMGDATNIVLPAAFSKVIQASGAWAAGNGGNGLFSGARANSTWYNLFVIKNDATGAVDMGFDTSTTAANRPAGWGAYRRIGSVFVTASGTILSFRQYGSRFVYVGAQADVTNAGLGNLLQIAIALTVPQGIRTVAHLIASVIPPNTNLIGVGFSIVGDNSTTNTLFASNGNVTADELDRVTNTARQVAIQANINTFATGLYVFTLGYTDFLED